MYTSPTDRMASAGTGEVGDIGSVDELDLSGFLAEAQRADLRRTGATSCSRRDRPIASGDTRSRMKRNFTTVSDEAAKQVLVLAQVQVLGREVMACGAEGGAVESRGDTGY